MQISREESWNDEIFQDHLFVVRCIPVRSLILVNAFLVATGNSERVSPENAILERMDGKISKTCCLALLLANCWSPDNVYEVLVHNTDGAMEGGIIYVDHCDGD